MECPVDPNMEITAVTHAKWWGAPGPLMCGPKSKYPVTGELGVCMVVVDETTEPIFMLVVKLRLECY